MAKQYLKEAYGDDTVLEYNGVSVSGTPLVQDYPSVNADWFWDESTDSFLITPASHATSTFKIKSAITKQTHVYTTQSFVGPHPPVGH